MNQEIWSKMNVLERKEIINQLEVTNPKSLLITIINWNDFASIEKKQITALMNKNKCEFFDYCKLNQKFHCRNIESLKESFAYCKTRKEIIDIAQKIW